MKASRGTRWLLWPAGLLVAGGLLTAVPSMASGATRNVTPSFAGTRTFTFTGAVEDWIVPDGVTSITALVCGASGENLLEPGSAVKFAGRPGAGGCVGADVRVTPGDVVHVRVGGAPTTSAGGWPNGGYDACVGGACGGSGGGSSDLRIGGDTLADRVLVGGGGGGGGGGALGGRGGDGGGGSGTDGFEGADGGDGAGLAQQRPRGTGGGGGKLVQTWNGGCGVANPPAGATECVRMEQPFWGYGPGLRGVDDKGGDSAFIFEGDDGGAGGGGYFGGGSGCGYNGDGTVPPNQGPCGGGGGSSYADPARTANHHLEQGTSQWYTDYLNGIRTPGDNGTVIISWPGAEVPVTTAPPTTVDELPPTGSGSNGGALVWGLAMLSAGVVLAACAYRRTT